MRGPATKTTSSAHSLPLQCKMTTARQMQTFVVVFFLTWFLKHVERKARAVNKRK